MRHATTLSTIALVMFFISGMAGLSLAAPQDSLPPSPGNTVPISFPDLRSPEVNAQNVTKPGTPPSSGDEVRIGCGYFVCGCFQNKVFSNRIDIDGALFYEKEGSWAPPMTTNPGLCSPENCQSYAWPITNTWKATPGNHTITCILDSKDNIYEGLSHELNNTKSMTVNVPLPKSAIDKIKDIKTKQPIPVHTPGIR
jgi:hypothetical protein